MAVFKEYSSGYEKDGYYVHISVSGADHPIPLQTPDEIADFYLSTGYTPGDQIPDQLVWSLYELDLHWTGEGGISRSDGSQIGEGSAPELAPEDVERIQDYIDSYSGEYAEDLEQLVNRLEVNEQSKSQPDFDLQEVFERTPPVEFSRVSMDFTNETKRRIQRWLPSVVMDDEDRKACDEHLDSDGFGKSPLDHLNDLLETPELEAVLDSHAAHPWRVTSVTVQEDSVVDSTENPDQPILTAMYDEDRFSNENCLLFQVQDLRNYQTSIDFEFTAMVSPAEKFSVAISKGEIVDFSVAPEPGMSGRFDRDTITEFATEKTDASPKSVTHSLVTSFVWLIPEVLDYCTAVPDYEIVSSESGTEYYEMNI
ncbi:hypothetical protein EXE49_09245 [Halorubrum sp. ASP121]|uniref:hypothetical protein n=1 Tax=Halorubrum sp. ASP121 TaxID=1855858 RepID=UPI0010F76652|nr:hypothetical protein [Halorubrum sp. ASP121]TKX49967.1 hypothetical protein EXE49_09245 [Halorubrum sp. ASP121]